MKSVLFIAALLLAGCSSSPKLTSLPEAPIEVAAAPPAVIAVQPATAPAPPPVPVTLSDRAVDLAAVIEQQINTGKVKIAQAQEVVTSIKTVVAAAKEVQQQIKNFSQATATPEPAVPPAAPVVPAPAIAPLYDHRTGFKVQVLGVDLQLWLGQNDSWSTIFKMLTLLIVGYGSFKGINLLFSRRPIRA